uniref:Grancalcin n=1 Tax=Sus scrofa TaxID=9823 RepID=A0A8W4FM64_PIG
FSSPRIVRCKRKDVCTQKTYNTLQRPLLIFPLRENFICLDSWPNVKHTVKVVKRNRNLGLAERTPTLWVTRDTGGIVMAYPGYGGGFGNFSNPMPGMHMHVGQPVPGAGPAVPPSGCPAYPPYSDSYPPAGDPMWTYFTAVAGQDGEVDAEELQKCLTQSGISGTYSPFSLETCRIMIAMLDRDCTGKMGFNEFKELLAVINAWKQNFINIDHDRSGTVEHHELNQAIAAMGYRLSPQTLTAIVKRYSKNGRIFFDDYVACCVKLRALTDFFRRRDHLQQGMVNFSYDDFLQGTMTI